MHQHPRARARERVAKCRRAPERVADPLGRTRTDEAGGLACQQDAPGSRAQVQQARRPRDHRRGQRRALVPNRCRWPRSRSTNVVEARRHSRPRRKRRSDQQRISLRNRPAVEVGEGRVEDGTVGGIARRGLVLGLNRGVTSRQRGVRRTRAAARATMRRRHLRPAALARPPARPPRSRNAGTSRRNRARGASGASRSPISTRAGTSETSQRSNISRSTLT